MIIKIKCTGVAESFTLIFYFVVQLEERRKIELMKWHFTTNDELLPRERMNFLDEPYVTSKIKIWSINKKNK